jgi:hypothetical protein
MPGLTGLLRLLATTPEGVFEALATTTLSSAVAVNDTSINVVSATSVAAGRSVRVDGEFMKVASSYVSGLNVPVLRGQDGTATGTHVSGANVTHGASTDFANPPAGAQASTTDPAQPAFPLFSYSVAGALNPVQGIHQINGTSARAMTLAAPTKDQDGQMMIIVSNGVAAHTVTQTSPGFGGVGATADVLTFKADQQQAVWLIASNGAWCLFGQVAAGATIAGIGLA